MRRARLDVTDWRILRELQEDGRITNVELARKVGISAPPCLRRVRALEEALLNFGGCAVVISHDRWFLDRIATHILAFEGDSKTVWCEGNYQTYEAQRRQRLGADADQPHRLRYKKLTH